MSKARSSRRYLSLWLPYLAADRWQRDRARHAGEHLGERCLVFVDKTARGARLSALCARAQSLRLHPDMSLADARAKIPDLHAVSRDLHAEHAFLTELADVATAFTPSVAFEKPDGLVLDLTGCVHLFGTEDRLAQRLRWAFQARGTSQCQIAIASTPDMARALARFSGCDFIRAEDDGAVRALPVAALECSPDDLNALRRAGLKTIGDVAARPSVLFSARFGQALTTQLARSLGEEDRRITPRQTPPPLAFDHRCAEPLASSEAIEVAVSALAHSACLALEARGEGGRKFEAVFFRTDGAIRRVSIETSRPLRDPDTILRLYRDRLQALGDPLDPGFGFDLIRFEVVHTQEIGPRQTSLDARAAQDDRVSALCDRLAAMFGRERILRIALQDTHCPERAQMMQSACDEKPVVLSQPQNGEGCMGRPLTLFTKPHPIEPSPGSRGAVLETFRWRRKMHEVAAMHGPERISEEWWRPSTGFGTRDYFWLETTDGQRFWIFRANATDASSAHEWFLHGVFP